MSEHGEFRYCCTYFVYGSREVDFGSDLADLVRLHRSLEEDGHESVEAFCEAVDGEWVKLDTTELDEQIEQKRRAAWKAQREDEKAKPWHVWIFGPDSAADAWSSHATREEAEAEAAKLPPWLNAKVSDSAVRPDNGKFR